MDSIVVQPRGTSGRRVSEAANQILPTGRDESAIRIIGNYLNKSRNPS
jgi:hypothetical protein